MLQQDLQTPKGQKEDDRMHDIASPSIRSTAGSTAGERRGVVVVGGGISGLALGAWLAREDVDVLVLERERGVVLEGGHPVLQQIRDGGVVADKGARYDVLVHHDVVQHVIRDAEDLHDRAAPLNTR